MDKKQTTKFNIDRNGISELFAEIDIEDAEEVTLEIPNLGIHEIERINLVASEFCYDLVDIYNEGAVTYITYEYCAY